MLCLSLCKNLVQSIELLKGGNMEEYYGLFGEKCTEQEFNQLNLRDWKKGHIDDKDWLFRYHMLNKFRKTLQMFTYDGLPDTIPKRNLELFVQRRGYSIFHYFDGNDKYKAGLYLSFGTLGGMPNYLYMPSKAIVNNPYLKYNKELTIDEDCVVIPNDSMYLGMLPINNYYSAQEVETDISMNILKINSRIMALLTAIDEDTRKDLEDVMNNLINGKFSVALGKKLLINENAINAFNLSDKQSTQTIIQLLEERQYVKGSWWNEIGVQSNYNMKRETITASENILNVDNILPLSDDMLEQRQVALEKVKNIFGVDIKVDFSSSWKKLRTEIKLKEEINQKEAKMADKKEVQSIEQSNKEVKENENTDTE